MVRARGLSKYTVIQKEIKPWVGVARLLKEN